MSVTFDKKDDNVVVVIGTGPGGGVLASELAQKGVKVVALEAGGRHGPEDFVNDEWASSDPAASDYRGSIDPITTMSGYTPDWWGLWKFEEVEFN